MIPELSLGDKMEFENMILDQEEGIATLTLNNPQKLNAMSTPMWNDFNKILRQIKDDDGIKVLVITGAGRDCGLRFTTLMPEGQTGQRRLQ